MLKTAQNCSLLLVMFSTGCDEAQTPWRTIEDVRLQDITEAPVRAQIAGRNFKLQEVSLDLDLSLVLVCDDQTNAWLDFKFWQSLDELLGNTWYYNSSEDTNLKSSISFGPPTIEVTYPSAIDSYFDGADYRLKLELGPRVGHQAQGAIYLCLNDESGSWVSGTFEAVVADPVEWDPDTGRRTHGNLEHEGQLPFSIHPDSAFTISCNARGVISIIDDRAFVSINNFALVLGEWDEQEISFRPETIKIVVANWSGDEPAIYGSSAPIAISDSNDANHMISTPIQVDFPLTGPVPLEACIVVRINQTVSRPDGRSASAWSNQFSTTFYDLLHGVEE